MKNKLFLTYYHHQKTKTSDTIFEVHYYINYAGAPTNNKGKYKDLDNLTW